MRDDAVTSRPHPSLQGVRRFRYLPQLDGVRALAVLAVIVSHTNAPFTGGGGVGVDVFFVLSGYLITTLLLQEFDRSHTVSLRTFYLRRIRRLLPALVAVSVFSAVAFAIVRPFKTTETLVGIATSLLYVSSWFRAFDLFDLGWFGHTWSLSVEEHFYFVWPPVLLLICRKNIERFRRWIVGLFALAVAYRLVSALAGVSQFRLYNSPDLRAEQLLAGCALAALLAGGVPREGNRWDGWWRVLATLSVLDLARTVAFGYKGFRAGMPALIAVESAIVIGYLVVHTRSVLARWLSHPALVWIGRRSYAMYLWHLPLYGLFSLKAASMPYRVGGRLAAIVLTFVAGWASFRWVESPLYRRRVEEKPEPDELAADTSGIVGPPEESLVLTGDAVGEGGGRSGVRRGDAPPPRRRPERRDRS